MNTQSKALNLFTEATSRAKAAFRFNQAIITCFNVIITSLLRHYYVIITHYYVIITSLLHIFRSLLRHYYVLFHHYYIMIT